MFLKKVVNFIIIGDFIFNFSNQGVEEGGNFTKNFVKSFFLFKFSADEKGEKNEKKENFFER